MLIKFFGPSLLLTQITDTLCALSVVSIVRSASGASQMCVNETGEELFGMQKGVLRIRNILSCTVRKFVAVNAISFRILLLKSMGPARARLVT